jgi:hypothetical protein
MMEFSTGRTFALFLGHTLAPLSGNVLDARKNTTRK